MNLKEHIQTIYSLKDFKRKLLHIVLKFIYLFPLISKKYKKEQKETIKFIEQLNPQYIIQLNEGLGNQMFQYAFAKSLEDKTKKKTLLNINPFSKPYRLNGFKISLNKVTLDSNFTEFNHFEEKTVNYSEDLINREEKTYFKGYFQSYKYFDNIKEELIEDFKAKANFTDEYNKMENLIKNSESVLLNFRVGNDYKRLGWMLDYNYQIDAILKIKELLPDKKLKFFIFADNIKKIKKEFKTNEDIVYVDLGKNNKDKVYLDLELMKKCKHSIIPNSSFSFWAAYLNENKNKIVIAPEPWFFTESDIIPNDWIKLNAKKIKTKNPRII